MSGMLQMKNWKLCILINAEVAVVAVRKVAAVLTRAVAVVVVVIDQFAEICPGIQLGKCFV